MNKLLLKKLLYSQRVASQSCETLGELLHHPSCKRNHTANKTELYSLHVNISLSMSSDGLNMHSWAFNFQFYGGLLISFKNNWLLVNRLPHPIQCNEIINQTGQIKLCNKYGLLTKCEVKMAGY